MSGPRSPRQHAQEIAETLNWLNTNLAQRRAISQEHYTELERLRGEVLQNAQSPAFHGTLGSVRVLLANLLIKTPATYHGPIQNTMALLGTDGLSGSQRYSGPTPQQPPVPPRQLRPSGRQPTLPDPPTHVPGFRQPPQMRGPGHTAELFSQGVPQQLPPAVPYATPQGYGHHPAPPQQRPLPTPPVRKGSGDTTAPFDTVMGIRQRQAGAGNTEGIWPAGQIPQRTDQGRPGAPQQSPHSGSQSDLPPLSLDGTGFALASETGGSHMPLGLQSAQLPDLSMGGGEADLPPLSLNSDNVEALPDLSMLEAGATYYGAPSDDIDAESQRKKAGELARDPQFSELYSVAELVCDGEMELPQLHKKMQSMGLLELHAQSPVWAFLHAIDSSPHFDYEEELIISEFLRVLRAKHKKQDMAAGGDGEDELDIPPKFANVRKKMALGVLGWHLRVEFAELRFELKRFLSAGGMGSVLLAFDHNTKRDVAIKVITKPGRDIQREAVIGGKIQLNDQGVVVYSGGVLKDFPYIVMPYLGQVRDLHALPKNLKLMARLALCGKMASAVSKMNKRGIIHRDIKPANFLATGIRNGAAKTLMEEMQVYTTDYGLARMKDEPDAKGILGTARFLPPEQAWAKPLSEKADVYALGISMYNVLTDAYPMPEAIWNDAPQLIAYARKLEGSAIQPTDRRLSRLKVPDHIIDLLVQMTDAKADNRPDAKEAEDIILQYIISQYPENRALKREMESNNRFRTIAFPLLMALLLALGIAGATYVATRRDKDHVAFGEKRKSHYDDLIASLSNPSLPTPRLRSLILTYRKADSLDEGEEVTDDNRNTGVDIPEGYTVDTEAGEPTNEVFDAALDAAELIVAGDELLSGSTPDFAGARQKYQAAFARFETLQEIINQRLERVNIAEVRLNYTTGLRAYRMGDVPEAQRRFSRCGALANVGLRRSEINGITEKVSVMENWAVRRDRIETEVLNSLDWQCAVRSGNRQFSVPSEIADENKYSQFVSYAIECSKNGEVNTIIQLLVAYRIQVECNSQLVNGLNTANTRSEYSSNLIVRREIIRLRNLRIVLSENLKSFLPYIDAYPGCFSDFTYFCINASDYYSTSISNIINHINSDQNISEPAKDRLFSSCNDLAFNLIITFQFYNSINGNIASQEAIALRQKIESTLAALSIDLPNRFKNNLRERFNAEEFIRENDILDGFFK